MPAGHFETPMPDDCFDGTISATFHEHGGDSPVWIIHEDQSWAVNVHWDNTGACAPFIAGEYDLHIFLESIGPGLDYNLVDLDPADHIIPLNPGPAPHYFHHVDIAAGAVQPGIYKPAVSLTYNTPAGPRGAIAGFVELGILQIISGVGH